MPHDPRITIRLLPRELKALRNITEAFANTPRIADMLGLGSDEINIAKDSLMHLPVLVKNTYTDHHAELTPDGWVVRAEKAA